MSGDLYRRVGKRLFDLTIAIPTLILLFPLLVLVALLVRLDSSGPALFVQERLGQYGKVFHIYKFRTMSHRLRIPNTEIIGRNPEVTRVGYWLRRFKFDELPQLLNVVKGDMSIVGPRPLLPAQLTEHDELGGKRLTVRPGLTGLAQVNGNIYLSYLERWLWDAMYVDHLSLGADLWIICRTVAVIILGENIFHKRLGN